jgi:hypothetical protein
MIPYRTHHGDWTISMWHSDNDTLLLKIEHADSGDYLTRLTGEIRMRRWFIGEQCAGALHPSPFKVAQPFPKQAITKEAILAAEGAG